MRWFGWLRRRTTPPPLSVEIRIDKAREAIKQEESRAIESHADAAHAKRVSRSLRQIRTENHFAELMRDALRPGGAS